MPGLYANKAENNEVLQKYETAVQNLYYDMTVGVYIFTWLNQNFNYDMCVEIWPEHLNNEEHHFWNKFKNLFQENVVTFWNYLDKENQLKFLQYYLKHLH